MCSSKILEIEQRIIIYCTKPFMIKKFFSRILLKIIGRKICTLLFVQTNHRDMLDIRVFPQIFIFIKLFVCADVFEIGWGLEILHPYNGFFYMKNIYLFSEFLLF